MEAAISPRKETGLYLIDASIYIFQAHFSPYVECSGDSDQDLSAIFGFTQFLFQFLRRTSPTHLAIARDESLQTGFRHDLHPGYKSNRELPDENLKMQLDACGSVVKALGIADYCSTRYEADDILGTLAYKAQTWLANDVEICIVSKDKDLAQLLADQRFCLWDYSGNKKRYRDDVIADYGVSPEQFPDYLGLIGDAVDVISGVPGIGPVKARALLQEFGSLQGIYDGMLEIPNLPIRGFKQLPALLATHRDAAFLSRQLATIVCNASEAEEEFATAQLSDLSLAPASESKFTEFLADVGFKPYEADRLLFQFNKLNTSTQWTNY